MRVFSKCWKRLLVKRLLVENNKKVYFNSASTTNQTDNGKDFIFKKNSTCSS